MKAFVDSCHSRGIAVIMDIVLNHCIGQSPFVQLYLDHYGTDQIYMKIPNPWFNASLPILFINGAPILIMRALQHSSLLTG